MSIASNLDFPNPTYSILQLKPIGKVERILRYPEDVSIFESNPIPTFSLKQIEMFKAELIKTESNIKALESFGFTFRFEINSVISLINRENLSQQELDLYTNYILFSFIAWEAYFEETNDLNLTLMLLDAVENMFAKTNNELLSQCFLSLVQAYYYNIDFSTFDLFLNPVKKFFSLGIEFSDKAYSIFPHFMQLILSQNNADVEKDINLMLQLIDQVVQKQGEKFPKESAEELMIAFSPLFAKLDVSAITIFGNVYYLLSHTTVTKILEILNAVIMDLPMNSSNFIPIPPKKGECLTLPKPDKQMNVITNFPKFNTFPDGLDLTTKISYPEPARITDICDPYFTGSVSFIIFTLKNRPEAYSLIVENFSTSIKLNLSNERILSQYSLFIWTCLNVMKKVDKMPSLLFLLYNPILFDPALTFDGTTEDNDPINIMRSAAIELIMNEGVESILHVLKLSLSTPDLFAEVLRRMITNFHYFINFFDESQKLLRLLTTALLYYQQIEISMEKPMRNARTSLFLFLTQCFSNDSISLILLNDSIFIRTFISFLFEPSLQSFVILQIRKILTTEKYQNVHLIIDGFLSLFEYVRAVFPEERSVQLLNDILVCFNELLTIQRSLLVNHMSSISYSLLNSIEAIGSSPICQEFMLNSIQFLTETSGNSFKLVKDDFIVLLHAIRTAFAQPTPALRSQLIYLMAGEKLSSTHPSFVIQEPYGALLFFRVYKQESYDFIRELCLFSSSNCHQCHLGELDRHLLKYIKEITDEKIIKDTFSLFYLIAVHSTSAAVVEQYVSIFSPINGKYLAPQFNEAMKTIISMVNVDLKEPPTIIPLIEGNQIESPNDITISTGFTFICWVYTESLSPQYYPSLLQVKDQNGHSLHLFISSNYLRISHHDDPRSKSRAIKTALPSHKWNFLAVSYRCISEHYYVIPTINNETDNLIEKSSKHFCQGVSKVRFGGVLSDSAEPLSHYLLGPFAFYSLLTSNQITELFSKGPQRFSQVPLEPIIIYNEPNRYLSQHPNFSRILLTKCQLSILFPFFTILDAKLEDETNVDPILDSAFEIFSTSFVTDSNVEIEFAKNKGFDILSYLLIDNDHSHIDYHLYLKFFTVMQLLKTDELKAHLFGAIMTNISLWVNAPPSDVVLVLKHWLRTLFPSFQVYASKQCRFSLFLNYLLIFMQDDQTDSLKRVAAKYPTIVSIPQTEEITTCRKLFCEILQYLASLSFTFNDFSLLMSYIAFVQHPDILIELARLVREIAYDNPSPLRPLVKEEKFVPYLQNLLQIHRVAAIGIDIFIHLHQENFLTEVSWAHEMNIIIRYLPRSVIDQALFGLVVQKCVEMPELFPLCCRAAHVLGDDSINRMTDVLEPTVEMLPDQTMLFWPVVASLFSSGSAKTSLFAFMVKCNPSLMSSIYNLIFIMSQIMQIDRDQQLHDYLFVCSILLLNKEIELSSIKSFAKLAKFFICFRELNYQNPAIKSAMNMSTYESVPPLVKEEEPKDPPPLKASDIVTAFTNYKLEYYIRFGIRFCNDGSWPDDTLAMSCIQLFRKNNVWFAFHMELFLLKFLYHTHNDFVLETLENLEIPPQLIDASRRSVDLLCDTITYKNDTSPFLKYHELNHNEDTLQCYDLFERSLRNVNGNVPEIDDIKSILATIQAFFNDNTEIYLNNRQNIIHDPMDSWLTSQESAIKKILAKRYFSEKTWRSMKYALTLPKAPWESLRVDPYPITRLQVGCYGGCPFKIKQMFEHSEFLVVQSDLLPCVLDNDSLFSDYCNHIKITKTEKKIISIYEDKVIIKKSETIKRTIPLSNIITVIPFNRKERNDSFELYCENGESFLIQFKSEERRNQAMQILIHKIPNEKIIQVQSKFDFILWLNLRNNRSFNDPENYPIFPNLLNPNISLELKRNIDISGSSISPEFFFMPEIYVDYQQGMDVIYENRKKLASEEYDEFIKEWITQSFSFSAFERTYSRSIFNSFNIPGDNKKLIFVDIYRDGSIRTIDTNGFLSVSAIESEGTKAVRSTVNIENFEEKVLYSSIYPMGQKYIIIKGENDLMAYDLYEESLIQIGNAANFVTTSDSWMIISRGGCFLDLFNYQNIKMPIRSLFYYHNPVVCGCVNNAFHAAVIATYGLLLVLPLETGDSVHTIDLQGHTPHQVIISPSWGFIVTNTTSIQNGKRVNSLFVHTINGKFVRQKQIDFQVSLMTTWMSSDGFDFLAVADNFGRIMICEIYILNIDDVIARCMTQLLALSYNNDHSILIAVAVDGQIFVIPI